jgi:ABC-2 type transport system ATP-binding protein
MFYCQNVKIIHLKNITKIYGFRQDEKKVVDNLTLSIDKGTIYGFLGPNGAGKTTTIKLILNLISPNKGTIKLFGNQNFTEEKYRIGYMSEQPYFYQYLTGKEVLDFTGRIFNLNKKQRQEKSDYLLNLVNLEKSANIAIGKYSKGMTQRLGLATALINDPELILLDEPLDGLDPIGRLLVKKIILQQKNLGKTIFFNSHILADAEEICDKVGIINNGQLIKEGNPKELIGKNKTLEKYFVKLINEQNEK